VLHWNAFGFREDPVAEDQMDYQGDDERTEPATPGGWAHPSGTGAPATTAPVAAPAWPPPPSMPRARERRANPARTAVVAGLVGALAGGGIAGGLVAALDRDPAPTTIVQDDLGAASRPSSVLAEPGDIRAILEKVQPAVVRIDTSVRGDFGTFAEGTGTGFVIDRSGVVVTNSHVVDRASTLTVTLNDGDEVQGRVVGTAPAFDLAVVKIEASDLPVVELGNSDELQVGDAVVAIGNALALQGGSGPTVTTGIVSGLGRDVRISATEQLRGMVQTDAAINPGNSGGPLVDVRGRVVGINTAIANPIESNNVGFAIPISQALPMIEELRAGRTPQAAFLGVITNVLTPRVAARKQLGTKSGAIVIEAPEAGTPAARADVRRDDVIVEIDGTAVRRPTDVLAAVRRHRPGDSVVVVIVRGRQRLEKRVTLASIDQ
jgi:S1-C subfamily serine protease